ncbi:MAG: DsbE family thiol:disulfide interchange protein [Pseudomonadota bacterium]|nr:DsbE family thiol:disulfide interchange protein [Pseudomonadota bacterium]
MSRADKQEASSRRPNAVLAAPLLLFAALAGLFYFGLFAGDPSKLPSALIGKPVPDFSLPPVEGLTGDQGKAMPGLSSADLRKGKVVIVNVWASWCVPCHAEHPFLTELAVKSGAPLYGINYKDDPASARRFVGRLGNPFAAVGADAKGSAAIDWGVYGVPETFIVSGDGRIAYKHVGPINGEVIEKTLLPQIAKAQGK